MATLSELQSRPPAGTSSLPAGSPGLVKRPVLVPSSEPFSTVGLLPLSVHARPSSAPSLFLAAFFSLSSSLQAKQSCWLAKSFADSRVVFTQPRHQPLPPRCCLFNSVCTSPRTPTCALLLDSSFQGVF